MTEPIFIFVVSLCIGVVLGNLLLLLYPCIGKRKPRGSNGNCVLMPPSTPAPNQRRIYYDVPSTVAECDGPCKAGPEYCDCGLMWHDVPRLDPGSGQWGNGSGAPTTSKLGIIPKPQFPSPRKIREDFLP